MLIIQDRTSACHAQIARESNSKSSGQRWLDQYRAAAIVSTVVFEIWLSGNVRSDRVLVAVGIFTTMDEERRHSNRQRALKGASIVFKHGGSTLICVVRNLSDGGARLGVEDGLNVPETFTLQFEDGRAVECTVVWRLAKLVGVKFAGG